MNEHYFITKHFPLLSAQKIIHAKKRGTTATAGVSPTMYSAISPHEQ